ncbi:hypothetical protein Halhy_3958 [Haliscomenobacter hydrossis DSM 1100]|uniref:Uncharacterized protein n=1 Tax=Haliscomenobacter hydrossis (strain ATCC 27775 / DSM 1100 / LMG 10767 / O) TaxID=760192 RepID=F4L4D7_HALH1|nr:hypothetical protein Halhy_3958 [Haliscomenobacter hydrossis DSM 1100]
MKISRSNIRGFFSDLDVKIWLKQKKTLTKAFTRWFLIRNLNSHTVWGINVFKHFAT